MKSDVKINYVDFEKPIIDIQNRIGDLKAISQIKGHDFDEEIQRLEQEIVILRQVIFKSITPMQKCKLARHPLRPYCLDYIGRVFDDFVELQGDRNFADDPAIVGGLASFDGKGIVVIGHQKGRGTKDCVYRNFGMPKPEGYRKAVRLMKMAEKFDLPIVTFIDTPGAYPGIGAEERGQAESIAKSLSVMSQLKVPIISFVIGEGGSGGALALSVCDRLIMLENAIFSVISPEGCAVILWKDVQKASDAAKALKLTADHLYRLKIIDEIIPEVEAGAHNDVDEMAQRIKLAIKQHIGPISLLSVEERLDQRYQKYRSIGIFSQEHKG